MRLGLTIAAMASALALGACGSDSSNQSSPAMHGSVTQPGTTQAAQAPSTATHTTTSQAATKTTQATTSTSTRSTITVGGQVESVAPGTRQACIHEWAPQFPAGRPRKAVLSQCKNLPR
jgi:hypothetical protein